MPTETVALSYNGSDTVVATITNAVIGNTYACTSGVGFVGGSGFVTATGTTLVLTIPGIFASDGDTFDIFVFNDSLFGGDDFNFLSWTLFAFGTASETNFPATWDYNGDKTISVTLPSSDPTVNYILSVFDETNGETDSTGTPGNGGDLTLSVTLASSPTPDYFRAALWDDSFDPANYRSVRLFTPGSANSGFPGNPAVIPPPESVAFAYDTSTDTVTATITNATPGTRYNLFAYERAFSVTSDLETAVGTTLVLTVVLDSPGPTGPAIGATFGAAVFNWDVPFGNGTIGWTIFRRGTTLEEPFTATWNFDGDGTVSITFLSILGIDYTLSILDDNSGESDSTTTSGTGASMTLTAVVEFPPALGNCFRAWLGTDTPAFGIPGPNGLLAARLFSAGISGEGFPGNPSTPPASSFDDSDTVATVTTVSAPLYYEDSETVATVTNPSIESEYVLHVDGSWGPFDDDDGIII